jgi:flagellin FlaB
VKYMNKENENARDSVAAIGIGAMIVFIALILVAAVASAVIIQTGEKLQQNAQQTGSDTQQEIGGKISIISAVVGANVGTAGDDEIDLTFELAPGSEPMDDDTVFWSIICKPASATVAVIVDGDFSAVSNLQGTQTAPADTLLPGKVYMITLTVGGAAATTCNCVLNEEHTMMISVQGGGSTYETLTYTDTTQGAQIV